MVADEQDVSDKLTGSINFGTLIAFFLPGSVSVYALHYPIVELSELLLHLKNGEKLSGDIIVLGIMSLVFGLIIDSVRGVLLDLALYKIFKVERNSPNVKKLTIGVNYNIFSKAIDNYYRYYQFYGNTLVAIILLVILRYSFSDATWFGSKLDGTLTLLSMLVLLVLFFSAKEHLEAMSNSIKKLNE